MTTVAASVEVSRVRKLFQHADLARTTSPFVKVVADPSIAENVTSSFAYTTKPQQETADPFFNETFDFAFTIKADADDVPLRVGFFVFDNNISPPAFVAAATAEIALAKSIAKSEVTFALQQAAVESESDCTVAAFVDPQQCIVEESPFGRLHIRIATRVTKPKAAVMDLDADIEPTCPVDLRGNHQLAPLAPLNSGHALLLDVEWARKLAKAIVRVFGAEADAIARGPRGGRNGRDKAPEPDATVDKVVTTLWKCKRTHQLLTKVRICAERTLRGEEFLNFTPDEETELKQRWKNEAAVRDASVAQPALSNASNGLRMQVDKLWVLLVTGEDVDAAGPQKAFTPSIEQRQLLQEASYGQQQYVALQAGWLQHVLPTLSAETARAIAEEDFWSNATLLSQLGVADPAVKPTVNPARGENAFKLFARQVFDLIHRLCEGFTEGEQAYLVRALSAPTLEARARAGFAVKRR